MSIRLIQFYAVPYRVDLERQILNKKEKFKMGRPIKKIFIGERAGAGEGGEGVASVSTTAGNSSGFTDLDALTITAPDLEGGVQAVGHVLSAAGAIDSAVITEPGSGYTSIPTVTAVTGGTQGTATLTAVLTTGSAIVILATAFRLGGSNLNADIQAQKGSDTYRVKTADGDAFEATLTTGAIPPVAHGTPNAAGEMQIIATDFGGATYSVIKLYNGHVRLENIGGSPEFADGIKVKWAEDGVAVVNYSVSITA